MPDARRGAGRARSPRHARGPAGCDVVVMLRLQSERMKGALLPSAGRVLQALRPHRGEARAREARRDRDASGPDEPRRRDRLGRRRRRAQRDPAAGDVRHRRADGGDEHDRRERDDEASRSLHGRVVDPATGVDRVAPLYVADGRVAALDADAAGLARRAHDRREGARRRAGARRPRRAPARAGPRVQGDARVGAARGGRGRRDAASRARPTPIRRSTSRGWSRC